MTTGEGNPLNDSVQIAPAHGLGSMPTPVRSLRASGNAEPWRRASSQGRSIPNQSRSTLGEWLAVAAFASYPLDGLVIGSRGLASIVSGVFVVVAILEKFLYPGRFRVSNWPVVGSILTLCLWAGLTIAWTPDTEAASYRLSSLLLLSVTTVMLAQFLPRMTSRASWGYLLVAGLLGVQVLLSPTANLELRRTVDGNENDVATFLAIAVVVGVCILRGRSRVTVVLGALLSSVCGVALIATGSRAGVLAVVAGLLTIAVIRSREGGWRRTLLATVVIVTLVVAFASALPGLIPPRVLGTLNSLGESDLSGRQYIWPAVVDHGVSPLGLGLGSSPTFLQARIGIPTVVHNVVLELVLEIGVVGLLLAVVLTLVAVRAARRSAFAGLVGPTAVCVSVMAMTLSIEWRRGLWLVLTMAATSATAQLAKRTGIGEQRRPLKVSARAEPQFEVIAETAP